MSAPSTAPISGASTTSVVTLTRMPIANPMMAPSAIAAATLTGSSARGHRVGPDPVSKLGEATVGSSSLQYLAQTGRQLLALPPCAWEGCRDPHCEEEEMPKYLLQASYAARGEEGVRAKGGTDRRDAVADTVRSIGGELECIYFEFGDHDALAIVDLPDNEAAAAMSLIENSTGALRVTTTVLLTPEQVDEASQRAVSYRPPGL